jgi:hypothetical protein
MMAARPVMKPVGGLPVGVSLAVLLALVWLGAAAPVGTHPLFYFGLIMLGGGALSLLFAGVGGLTIRSRVSAGQLDAQFVAGIRRLTLAMLLCALVLDAVGCLIVLAVANGRGNTTPLDAPSLIIVFLLAAVTIAVAAITSFALRQLLPRH